MSKNEKAALNLQRAAVVISLISLAISIPVIITKLMQSLAKAGVLTVTGERQFRRYGKYLYAKTYSAFDYFRLTPEEVRKALDGSK